MDEFLESSLVYLKGVGSYSAELLKKELGLVTIFGLLQHYPFRYVDRSKVYSVKELNPSMHYVQVKVRLISKVITGNTINRRLVVLAAEEEEKLELVWFKSVLWFEKHIRLQHEYIVFGKPTWFNGQVTIVHPELELLTEFTEKFSGTLQPVYPATEKLKKAGFDSRGMQRIIYQIIADPRFTATENLPESVVSKLTLQSRKEALVSVHNPKHNKDLEQAITRIKFEELFILQVKLLKQKTFRIEKSKGLLFTRIGSTFNEFYFKRLPFALTNAQKKVIREIRHDTLTGHQMNRLLQGDVGSGKTIVALLCMLIAVDNGYQACMMAPTEILAAQHYQTLINYLCGGLVQVALITGSVKANLRKKILQDLKNGVVQIIIGTHALLEDEVEFQNLGFVVIDEQHRFGVQQRAKLWEKGSTLPHILVMTATPIPRTLAMTLYGDLDVSVIDALPEGRKPIKTYHYFENLRLKLFGFIGKQIELGRQIYVVYPLIEESETLDLLHLKEGFELLERAFPKPAHQISIVHGKMKAAAKEIEMGRFIRGETQIMVATTVIEVGVNIPNATVMVIENAERFGLSTLHQLRGRVGRGGDQSYCILMTSSKISNEAKLRLETMVRTNDGFEIAEADLQIRGMGDLEGLRQSGVIDLKLANLSTDQAMLRLARFLAEEIIAADPALESKNSWPVKSFLSVPTVTGVPWDQIS